METPTNAFYEGLSEVELHEQLRQVEAELEEIHVVRAELNTLENHAQEHRDTIVRTLGVFVLDDRRHDVTERG